MILHELLSQKKISVDKLAKRYDQITQDVIRAGGLINYTRGRLEGKVTLPEIDTPSRPMTMVEKIIANHWVNPDGSVIS